MPLMSEESWCSGLGEYDLLPLEKNFIKKRFYYPSDLGFNCPGSPETLDKFCNVFELLFLSHILGVMERGSQLQLCQGCSTRDDFVPPRGLLTMFGHSFGCHNWRCYTCSGWRPGTLINSTVNRTARPLPQRIISHLKMSVVPRLKTWPRWPRNAIAH